LSFSLGIGATPGRPEELHLQSPTDPYVSLSTRTARASLSRAASPLHGDAESSSLLPVAWLASPLLGLAPPLRSLLITRSSPLLRENPPPPGASILSPFVGFTYRVFSLHHPESSHVPQKSPDQARATCTPGATAAVSRSLRGSSWSRTETPLLTPSVERFRRLPWFAHRSPSWSSPDSSRLPFPHRSRPCPFGLQPREGVWSLCLHADSEGPSLISFATSWRNGSHVPHRSPEQGHAAFMPDAVWAVDR